MKNTRKLSRMFLAFSLLVSLGVAPTLTAYAQQPAQEQQPKKQSAPQAKSPAAKTQQAADEKKLSSADDPLPLSDAEMDKVEGGFGPLAGFFAGVVVTSAYAYLSHRSHEKILRACTPTRRR